MMHKKIAERRIKIYPHSKCLIFKGISAGCGIISTACIGKMYNSHFQVHKIGCSCLIKIDFKVNLVLTKFCRLFVFFGLLN